MFRKVTRTGPATLTLALPAESVKEQKLKQGQYVEVNKLNNNLLISTQTSEKHESVRIRYDELLIENMLEKLFLESESEIVIYDDNEIPKSVNNIIKKFPGMQVVEEEPKKITITRTLKPDLEKPKPILKRCYIIINEALKDNPAQFTKELDDMMFLLQIHQKRPKEVYILKEFYTTLSNIKKPVQDDTYSLIRTIYGIIYNQKYVFNPEDTKKLAKLFIDSEDLFQDYLKDGKSKIEIAKLYYCKQLLSQLHKEIIYDQSINTLNETRERKSKKQFTIGVCLKNQSNAFWAIDVKESIQNTAKKYTNTEYVFNSPMTDFNIGEQERILNEFIKEEMNGIILAPVMPKSLEKTVAKINKAKIPLLILDTDIELDKKYTFIGFDNYKGGYLTGEYMKKKLSKHSTILIIEGHAEGNFSKRVTGCIDALGKDYETIVVQGEFQESIAYEKVILAFKKYCIDAIFATSDNMAQGAIKAIKNLGKNILVCGFDMTQIGLSLYEKKEIQSVVNTRPAELGILAVQTMNSILKGETVANKIEYQIDFVARK